MSDFTVYKPRNGQILKNGRVMSASDLAVELAQLQATNARLVAERDEVIAALYKIKDIAGHAPIDKAILNVCECYKGNLLDELKLEQQAKGIAEFLLDADADKKVFKNVSDLVIYANKKILSLVKQAKE